MAAASALLVVAFVFNNLWLIGKGLATDPCYCFGGSLNWLLGVISVKEALGWSAFWIALGIIFAECGLLIGFFLPGDSLLFVAGAVSALPQEAIVRRWAGRQPASPPSSKVLSSWS